MRLQSDGSLQTDKAVYEPARLYKQTKEVLDFLYAHAVYVQSPNVRLKYRDTEFELSFHGVFVLVKSSYRCFYCYYDSLELPSANFVDSDLATRMIDILIDGVNPQGDYLITL